MLFAGDRVLIGGTHDGVNERLEFLRQTLVSRFWLNQNKSVT